MPTLPKKRFARFSLPADVAAKLKPYGRFEFFIGKLPSEGGGVRLPDERADLIESFQERGVPIIHFMDAFVTRGSVQVYISFGPQPNFSSGDFGANSWILGPSQAFDLIENLERQSYIADKAGINWNRLILHMEESEFHTIVTQTEDRCYRANQARRDLREWQHRLEVAGPDAYITPLEALMVREAEECPVGEDRRRFIIASKTRLNEIAWRKQGLIRNGSEGGEEEGGEGDGTASVSVSSSVSEVNAVERALSPTPSSPRTRAGTPESATSSTSRGHFSPSQHPHNHPY